MKTKVKFLYNENNEDLFAYFPEIKWNEITFTSYSHYGQHSACCKYYAAASREAGLLEYLDLFNELQGLGYDLELV